MPDKTEREENRFVVEGANVHPDEKHKPEKVVEDVDVTEKKQTPAFPAEPENSHKKEAEADFNLPRPAEEDRVTDKASMNERRPGNTVDGKPEILNSLRPGNTPNEQRPVRGENRKGSFVHLEKHDDKDIQGKHYLKDVRMEKAGSDPEQYREPGEYR